MLCAKILRVQRQHGRVFLAFEHGFLALAQRYEKALAWAVRHRWLVVGGSAATVLLAVGLFTQLKREFVPPEDRGYFVTFVMGPEGASLEYTNDYQRRVEEILGRTADVEGYFSIVGGFVPVSQGIIFTMLKDWDQRDRKVQDVLNEVQPQFFGIPGIMAFANNPPAFGFGSPVNYVVQDPDFDRLMASLDTMVKRARQIPGLINVNTDLRVNKPELTVEFDRDRAEDLGVPVRDVAGTLQTLLGGRRVSTFTRNNKLYDVIVRLFPEERATPGDIPTLYVRGRGGELVQLDALATVKEGVGPQRLIHFNRVRSFTLTAGLAPGFTLGEALDSLDALAAEVLPEGTTTALAGESRELQESGASLYFAFGLALLVVFMVLASQFESLVHPFTVLLAVPLAVTGALAALYVAGSTINLYSQIGMILLIGLVTKNSILLVEFTNQLRERGMDTVAAVLEAGRVRLRPIVMTSVATIMGAMPIAFGLGAGSMSRKPLGYAIIGGILFSTVLTLFLVPVAYVLLDRVRERLARRSPALRPVEAE
jgi:multidrug efflux pump